MSKKKILPSVDQLTPGMEIVGDVGEELSGLPMLATSSVSITLPIALVQHGHGPRNVYVNGMNSIQRNKLRQLLNGLIADESKLQNGKCVKSPQDAFKFLLESLSHE